MDERNGDRVDPDTFEGAVMARAAVARVPLDNVPGGEALKARFVEQFGVSMRDDVRPLLPDVTTDGRDAQLVVNGLAELLRSVASAIEASVPGAEPS